MEYFSEKEIAIPYHGHSNLLFKRDYKNLFPNLKGTGLLTKEEGFDKVTWWLFEKGVKQ